MRKRCGRTARRVAAPTVVAYFLNPEVSTQERMAVEGVRAGWATTSQFDVLADCRDMLTLAALKKRDEQTLAVCEVAGVALTNMRVRYQERQRIGATGDELSALVALVDVSEDFWKRQGGRLFIDADAALKKVREEFRETRQEVGDGST